MNREELKKYVDHLDDNAEIIVITKDQTSAIPKHCQRIDTGGKTIWVVRMLKHAVWTAVIAWILQAPLDYVPKPKAVFLAAEDKVQYVMTHIDYSYPYNAHDAKYPQVAYNSNDATYFTPSSGLSPEAIAATGSFGAT